jgi:hypothetical protein
MLSAIDKSVPTVPVSAEFACDTGGESDKIGIPAMTRVKQNTTSKNLFNNLLSTTLIVKINL